jgi:hypothetical protein
MGGDAKLIFFFFIEDCSGISSKFAKLQEVEIYDIISSRIALLFR